MFQKELLRSFSQTVKLTEKYRYTLEVREVLVHYYRINYPTSYSCTMYPLRELAEQAAREHNNGRAYHITEQTLKATETIKHRFKRG